MTPKEKARELYFKYHNLWINGNSIIAKQCALIAVDEMLVEYQSMSDLESTLVVEGQVFSVIDKLVYWQEVKEEINGI